MPNCWVKPIPVMGKAIWMWHLQCNLYLTAFAGLTYLTAPLFIIKCSVTVQICTWCVLSITSLICNLS
jgi:hypothetical protein